MANIEKQEPNPAWDEKRSVLNKKVKLRDVELNHRLWRMVLDDNGFPVAALYFNGREWSLPQEDMEELFALITEWAVKYKKGVSNGM